VATPNKKSSAGCGCLLVLAGACLIPICTRERHVGGATGSEESSVAYKLLHDDEAPAGVAAQFHLCQEFFAARSDLGTLQHLAPLSDYACGARAAVTTSRGEYECYLKDGAVATIWARRVGGVAAREVVYQNSQVRPCSAVVEENSTRPAKGTLPAYIVLKRINLIQGGQLVEILVKSLRPVSPNAEVARIAKGIAQREAADGQGQEVVVYCSEAAYKANGSERFLKSHPNAMRCLLGTLKDGIFQRYTP
jgi:hypothetical protein